ncbi:MAG: molybdopterin-guanine dinucleotide biosynthesis protein B [Candidatus Baldrarchaeia archaeon]
MSGISSAVAVMFPVIAVVGRKNSGKTTLIERLTSNLTRMGFRVATAKHVSIPNFSIDRKGTDTWRHGEAGANPVICVSDVEICRIERGVFQNPLNRVLSLVPADIDLLLLEGFYRWIADNENIAKIVCVRTAEEYEEYRSSCKNVLLFCSRKSLDGVSNIINIDEEFEPVVRKVIEYVEEFQAIKSVLEKLPRLNCKKCGRASCMEMAREIVKGTASFSDCVVLSEEPKVLLRVGNVNIPLQPFVMEIIRRTILGMISTLKGVKIRGDERIRLEVLSWEGEHEQREDEGI